MQCHRLPAAAAFVFLAASSALHAQQTPFAAPPKAGSNWARVEALPSRTKVHITADGGSSTCRIFGVTDDALTCEAGSGKAGKVIQRTEIRHVKLAHYGRSTLVGAGIGGGVGALAGGIAGRTKPCPTGQTLCFNGIGIGTGGVAAIFGVAAAVVGAAVGGPADIARGSSIYVRP